MFYQPELIVYLWLLPVTCLVVIPAALTTCRGCIGVMKKTAAPEKDYKIFEQEQSFENKALAQ